jgi:NOL1/NOP2/fmu family ribosome biogenesis protein
LREPCLGHGGPSDAPAANESRRDDATGQRGHGRPPRVGRTDRDERRRRSSPPGRGAASAKGFAALPPDWGRWLAPVAIDARRDRVFAWPEGLPPSLASIAHAGTELAFVKGQTWFPAYALAMRRDGAFEPRARVEIEEQSLRRFLGGENVAGGADGWAVATYAGLPLGWVKGDGRMLKNHLPKSVRLLLP